MKKIKCIKKVVTGNIIEEIINLLNKESCFIYVSKGVAKRLKKEYFWQAHLTFDEFRISREEQDTYILIDNAKIKWRSVILGKENGNTIDNRNKKPKSIYFLK